MGAWGPGAFENDHACDWAYGLEEVDDLSLVTAALQAVLDAGSGDLDSDVSVEALAACEVLARLHGHWGERDSYTETTDAWVEAHPIRPPPDLIAIALLAIDRVVSEPSELLELWDEGVRSEPWHAAVEELRARVGRAPGENAS